LPRLLWILLWSFLGPAHLLDPAGYDEHAMNVNRWNLAIRTEIICKILRRGRDQTLPRANNIGNGFRFELFELFDVACQRRSVWDTTTGALSKVTTIDVS
jgi:hypothetical protein